MKIDKWLEIVYKENEFGRSISISLSGTIGLIIYLYFNDITIALFSLVISFPLFRIIANSIYSKFEKRVAEGGRKTELEKTFSKFSKHEIDVIKGFVQLGSCALSFDKVNYDYSKFSGIVLYLRQAPNLSFAF